MLDDARVAVRFSFSLGEGRPSNNRGCALAWGGMRGYRFRLCLRQGGERVWRVDQLLQVSCNYIKLGVANAAAVRRALYRSLRDLEYNQVQSLTTIIYNSQQF